MGRGSRMDPLCDDGVGERAQALGRNLFCRRAQSADDCAVCMMPMQDRRCMYLKCGHALHVRCWTNLRRARHNRCPLCRRVVVDKTISTEMQRSISDLLNSINTILDDVDMYVNAVHFSTYTADPGMVFVAQGGTEAAEGVLQQLDISEEWEDGAAAGLQIQQLDREGELSLDGYESDPLFASADGAGAGADTHAAQTTT